MFSGSSMADDRKVGKKYRNKAAVAAIYVSGGTGGAVFVRKQGSITVEAACVMAVVLFSLAALIENAGRIHDETISAMVLHEAVEKCRHERENKTTAITQAASTVILPCFLTKTAPPVPPET